MLSKLVLVMEDDPTLGCVGPKTYIPTSRRPDRHQPADDDGRGPRPDAWMPRLAASFFGLFGAVALVLAAVGIYGVTAYAVSQRTHEIGVRMALGARRRDILHLMVREGLGQTGLGVVLGLAGALVTARAFEAFLYGVSPTDLKTLTAVSSFLAAVALAACYIPARRGAGVDPSVLLRYE